MEPLLAITVRFSNQRSSIRVDPRDAVSSLLDHFPQSTFRRPRFVHRGAFILPALTFAFHGICDGEEVVIFEGTRNIPPPYTARNSPGFETSREGSINLAPFFCARMEFSLQRAVQEFTNPGLSGEIARLRDQSFGRVEGNIALHRRLVTRFLALHEEEEPRRISAVHDPEAQPSSPNSDELPCIWSRRKKSPPQGE
jgi:hypothetical protein